jgi:predicted dehydrogenase
MSVADQIRTAVIGTGHLGREHARVYATLAEDGQSALTAVCDLNQGAGESIAGQYRTRYVSDYRELIGKVDAVSVSTPTVNHCEIANAFLDAGADVLVEKPIARTVAEADMMIATAQKRGCILQVGHIERFNPAFQALEPLVREPRFFEVHRMGIFTPRSLDIDVVMDLMVHELDIVSALVGSDVVRLEAVGIPILTPRIDLANARLEYASGCIANITASRVAGERLRKLRVFQPNEYFSLDYAQQEVAVCRLIPAQGRKPKIVAGMLEVARREPLLAEIEHFLDAVRNRREPIVSGIEGRRSLALANEVLEKIREHSNRAGLNLKLD